MLFIGDGKMALLTVYRRSVQIIHSSPICSFAFLFRAAVCLLTYVPPFFVAYFTGGKYSATEQFPSKTHCLSPVSRPACTEAFEEMSYHAFRSHALTHARSQGFGSTRAPTGSSLACTSPETSWSPWAAVRQLLRLWEAPTGRGAPSATT